MDMNCLVCNKEFNLFNGHKVSGGWLCKSCAGKLPTLLILKGQQLQKYSLINAMESTAENLKRFSATASFGQLHIDEVHGLFCIANSLTADGKPKKGNNVFSVYDLLEVGLTCTSPRETNNIVYVDVEFQCSLTVPFLSFSQIIKRKCKCKSKRIDTKNFTWEQPGDFLMFQELFNQSIFGAWEKVNRVLCGQTTYEHKLELARAVFMLSNGFTQDDVNCSYKRLKKVYDTDNKEIEILNQYYCFLLSYLEQN